MWSTTTCRELNAFQKHSSTQPVPHQPLSQHLHRDHARHLQCGLAQHLHYGLAQTDLVKYRAPVQISR